MQLRDRKNAVKFIFSESAAGFLNSLIIPTTVLAVLLKQMGASETTIGAIFSIETGFIIFPQFLGNFVVSSLHSRKRRIVLWHMLAMAPFLFLMGALIHLGDGMPDSWMRWGLLLVFACYTFDIGIIEAVWMDWLAHIFPQTIRGRVMGANWAAASIMGTGAALLAGRLIVSYPGRGTYAWLYIGAGCVMLAQMIAVGLIDDPALEKDDRKIRLEPAGLLRHFRMSLENRNYRLYLIGRILGSAGYSLVPFLALYYTSAEGGGLSAGVLVACGAGMQAGMAGASLLFGRLGDKKGHRIGMIIGLIVQAATLVLILSSAGLVSCVLAYVGAGICYGSRAIAGSNLMFETCPHESRLAHITVGNLILSVATIGGPVLAGAVAEGLGLKPLFWVCLAFSLAALLWFGLLVEEPRNVRPDGC